MWGNVKKIVLSLSVIVLFALYALQRQLQPTDGRLIFAAALPTASLVSDKPIAKFTPTFAPTATTPPEIVPRASPTENGRPMVTQAATVALPKRTLAPTPTRGSAIRPTTGSPYRDGTYMGIQADAYWGTVEIAAVIADGQLSDVQFIDYPNHRSRSVQINQRAMPMLIREAIQSQQSDVDIVSGATDTSEAFIQSLGSALRQATS